MKSRLPRLLIQFLALPVIAQLPSLPVLGNTLDGPGTAAYLSALAAAALPGTGSCIYSPVTNASTTALTLNTTNCPNGIINATVVTSGGSANTNTTDTATNIIKNFWPNAFVGATAPINVANLNSGTMTLAGGTGVTISGTATTVTLANTFWQAKITNLANPALPGAVATNTTSTSAAVAANSTQAAPSSIIPVASATGIVANASYLRWVNSDGTTTYSLVTAVNSLNITVQDPIPKAVLSGAVVTVYNNAITITRMYSCVTATLAA